MVSTHWARLSEDSNCGLRRGAWYRITGVEPGRAVVDVGGGSEMPIPKDILEITSSRPAIWTVVVNSGKSLSFSARGGKQYAVCPCCRERQMPMGQQTTMRCRKCNGLFDVAWDQPFTV